MVMKEYGKFHAISVAIQDQQPEKFKKILAPFKHTFDKFKESGNSNILFSSSIEEVYDLLKDDLEESIMNRWKNFKQQVDFVLNDISEDLDGLKVIVHGDCWNNNFMYYSENNEKNLPKKVALLDWQMSRFTTPITDLSYFLFACISQEDLENLNEILRNYYKSFSHHLKRLGSDPDRLYSFDQLLKDWKTYCKYGIMMASVILKIALTEKDEIVDIAQAAEQGQDIVSSFSYEIQNKTPLRNRLRPFVKYVVEHDLKDNLKDITVQVAGNSGKGEGFLGDVVFVLASGTTENGSTKEYDLVIKCGKRSQFLRKISPIRNTFLNEIYVFDELLPAFTRFQVERGIADPFNSVAKCYGSFVTDNMEVLVLGNMNTLGYELWDKKIPLTRKHIDLVMREYGKFHAISAAMNDQEPDTFQKLIAPMLDIFNEFRASSNLDELFRMRIEEVYDMLKHDLDESIMLKWRDLKNKVTFVFGDMIDNIESLKVVLHSDCWNNNFLYYSESNDKYLPTQVAILDWQITRFSSPVIALSYFLFVCISQEDLENLNDILKGYYKSFSDHLKRLGTDPSGLYTFDQLLDDWKNYSKYGIMMASLSLKVCSTESDDIGETAQEAEKGQDFTAVFMYDIKDNTIFKNRIRPIVKLTTRANL
ncbi:uncharacterized protein BDFB_009194, partial [Asbolus verrucosus]